MPILPALFNVSDLHGIVLSLLIVVGLCLLIFGGDWLCRGAASLAIRLNVAPVVVGLTVVSVATSAPELFTALVSVQQGQPGLAIGNIIGSNAANMGLVLAVAALISPIAVHYRLIRWEAPILLFATALFGLLCYIAGGIGRLDGALLLLLTVVYMVFIVRTAKGSRIQEEIAEEIPARLGSIGACIGLILAGGVFLWFGADLLVDAASESARRLGVSETLIGMTVVAIGTSLPELGATIAAALRRQSGIIVGNILGSNLFNLILICGVVGFVLPFPVDPMLVRIEIPAVFLFTLVFAWFIASHRQVNRIEGGILLALYVLFLLLSSIAQSGGFDSTLPAAPQAFLPSP